MPKNVSILIPVINEEEIIEENTLKLINFLSKAVQNYEILICDNGSEDSTAKIGRELEKKFPSRVHFYKIPQKRAVGYAFKKNVKNAKYDYFVCMDMDLSVGLNFIKKSLNLLKKYDVIIGSKQIGNYKRDIFRRFLSWSQIFITRLLLGLNYHDYSMAAKSFKREVVMHYLDKVDEGSSYPLKIAFYAKRDGFKIIEIPVFCNDTRPSKFSSFHESLYRLRSILSLFFRGRILEA